MTNAISLPPKIFTIYNFFEKTKDSNWDKNPFVFCRKIYNIDIKIAKNISNLNFYQMDFIIDKQINPTYIIKYFKNIQYRNHFSSSIISFKEISKTNENNWIEEEIYNGNKNIYNCILTEYQLLFYTNVEFLKTNTSDAKYYNSYKILTDTQNYILRFETVLNNLDIDQNIDINIYVNMIINILKAIYNQYKIKFTLDSNNN